MTVNGQSSRPAGIFFGVPQGSVLGHILFILYSAPLCLLTEIHSVSNQSFADDTQLRQSCPPDQRHATALTMQACISDVTTWVTQNKLKMNDDKTEALLVKSDRTSFLTLGPTSIRVGTADISFMTCAQKPWFHDFRQHAS